MIEARPHPAKFPEAVLRCVASYLTPGSLICDPMAGVGGVHALEVMLSRSRTVGIEIEPEWACVDRRTLVGNALALPFPDASFDAIVTSPTWGNRMADHHVAKDACKTCDGTGRVGGTCPNCKGSGLSDRNTYRHRLGRMPHPASSATLAWGESYRVLHAAAWREAVRVLRPGGRFVINLKNRSRVDGSTPYDLVGWHVGVLSRLGLAYVSLTKVPTVGFRKGANRARVPHECVVVFDAPAGGLAP